ncbi:hypothetical protein N9L19_00035 [bacterium]|nr:hypothetical protein [bacterium]
MEPSYVMARQKIAKTISTPQTWRPPADDDELCGCPDCMMMFHRERARWARELVNLARKGRESKTKMQACKRITVAMKGKSTYRFVKQGKGDGNSSKRVCFPRGWMPWTQVIQEISEWSIVEPEEVKLVLGAVKDLGTREVKAIHAFFMAGLAISKVEKGPCVVVRACECLEWDCMSAYGLKGRP